VLASYGYPTEGFRAKNWDEFAKTKAPKMDFVFTVCDSAAGELRRRSKARTSSRQPHSSPRSNISGTGFQSSSTCP
jgi:hypothetical protein